MTSIRQILFISLLSFFCFSIAENPISDATSYEVHQIYPHISITKVAMEEAETLSDIYERYEADWVKEYISVELQTIHKGETQKTMGTDNKINSKQRTAILNADTGTEMTVIIHYIPDNTLKQNDVKENSFTFSLMPERDAVFSGGKEALEIYLNQNAISEIPSGTFVAYDLAAVKFTIDTKGNIINPEIFESSKDEEVDALLISSIQNMPKWIPASYADGTIIEQDYVLMVGNMKSCIVNLLNIRKERD